METKTKIYPSKFGYGILAFLTILCLGNLGLMCYQNLPLEAFASTFGIFALIYLLFIYLIKATKYEISNTGVLKVKCGIFYNERFDINTITSVAKTNNMISSPAPSLDRIEVKYGTYNSVILSPKDKFEFAQHLTKINPKIDNQLKA